MPLISLREFARRNGVDVAAISRAVKAGRLPSVEGKIDLDQAQPVWDRIKGPRARRCQQPVDGNELIAREVLPQWGSEKAPLTWYEPAGGTLQRHVVSAKSYGHGIGVGDVNGDGRNDIVTPQGWLEAPRDPRTGDWKMHPEFTMGQTGFIFVIDINEDGLPDLLTSNAHDYGIFWMEQRPDHTWVKHAIDESWSQAHAMTLVDLNADGRKELLTGKRFMAHDGHDPGEHDPLGIYWYEYHKSEDGKSVVWSRHVVEYGSRAGGGMQIPVVDIDGDGDLDFAVGGKSGLFLFENLTKGQARRNP